MDSPPKRMTRARAAKATEPKTTKIVTAAAKARTASTATAGTKSTAAKRKTRADNDDDSNDEDEFDGAAARRTRGRPKKTVATATDDELAGPVAVKPTRARDAKKPATEAAKEEAAPAKARGRPKKVVETAAVEAPKKTTRARAGTTSKATSSTTATKPAIKKTVKFQEPDKENMDPPATKEPVATAIRGRPARRGGAAAARPGRPAAKTTEAAPKKPLSPKKVTQMPFRDQDSSEDELAAMEKPVKTLKKGPIKPPVSPRKVEPEFTGGETDSTIEVNAALLDAPELGASIIASPPRRLPASPYKDSLKSPAKRVGAIQLPGSAMKLTSYSDNAGQTSPFKSSLLMSAAKRPQSPIKGLFDSAQKPQHPQSSSKSSMFQSPAKRAFPGFKALREPLEQTIDESPKMKPIAVATPVAGGSARPSELLMMEEQEVEDRVDELDDDPFQEPIRGIRFPGRLSAVMPRDADPDPTLDEDLAPVEDEEHVEEAQTMTPMLEHTPELAQEFEQVAEEVVVVEHQSALEPAKPVGEADDCVAVDQSAAEIDEPEASATTSEPPLESPALALNPMFQLREKDLRPDYEMYSDSEDELASPTKGQSPTRTQDISLSPTKPFRRSTLGLSSLADQFGSWSAGSPLKDSVVAAPTKKSGSVADAEQTIPATTPAAQNLTMENNFFEDQMVIRPAEKIAEPEVDDVVFADVMVTDEDVALAQEADDMSILGHDDDAEPQPTDDTLSEASQEYGDENQVPIDPALMASHGLAPVTPLRPVQREFHTTTKVPLKPEHNTPSPIKKRSFSASRVAPRRPNAPSRNATVISYSPTKDRRRSSLGIHRDSAPSTPGAASPTKDDILSTMGTPARTPRKDINPALLRGAIVHVDVHTSEGADASGIFVDLLTQMGARCVKTWTWNPSGAQNSEASSSKVGITHVVYKDGGKRTLEKVREANGVVQCVGVSWVLDCERENDWLDEAPYYIDTSIVPRGGARRRKSMEPQALANLNGTLVSSPTKGGSSTSPTTPMNRRQSTVWMHTPSDQGDGEDDDVDWSQFILTPVPKTPAPEQVARYAAEIPETPSVASAEEGESPDQTMLMRTCPPQRSVYREDVLTEEKDEQVMWRLMAARRKSLQFAPKIASPLSKTWK